MARKPIKKSAKKSRSKIVRKDTNSRMSQVVVHGDTVYLAGVVADKTVPSVRDQTQQVLRKIDALLKKAGTDKKRILKANIWLSNIANFAEMNQAWEAWAPKGETPARATVESKLVTPDYLVEIMVEAAL
jgi:enamine deaminase RidA (YjgF/YER057c/UK114 family)